VLQPALTFVPQPNLVVVRRVEVSSIPQANVVVIIPINIAYIPQPSISTDVRVTITGIRQPSLFLSGVTGPVPEITVIRQPSVEGIRSIVIMHIGQPSVQTTLSIVETGDFFWGFTPYAVSTPRASNVSYMLTSGIVNVMLNATDFPSQGFLQRGIITPETNTRQLLTTNWQTNLPVGAQAFLVFLIPSNINLRNEWMSPGLGTGPIGGALNETISGNHWPNPDGAILHNGRQYNLYVGNRIRRISGDLILIG